MRMGKSVYAATWSCTHKTFTSQRHCIGSKNHGTRITGKSGWARAHAWPLTRCMAIDPLHGQCLTPAIGNNLPCNPLGFGKQVVPVHTSFQDGKGMPHTNPTDKYWTSAQAGSRAQNLQK
jgi:hypothetical protein